MGEAERGDPPQLPEASILELEDYPEMHRAVGRAERCSAGSRNPPTSGDEETRYRIVATLLREGELSATELAEALDLPSNRLHYHLDRLVEVGLVANRKRKERGADGLYSYYVATSMGEAVMRHGIGELIRREWEALERYG